MLENPNISGFRPLYTGLVSNCFKILIRPFISPRKFPSPIYGASFKPMTVARTTKETIGSFRPLYTGLVSNSPDSLKLELKENESFRPLYTGLVSNS